MEPLIIFILGRNMFCEPSVCSGLFRKSRCGAHFSNADSKFVRMKRSFSTCYYSRHVVGDGLASLPGGMGLEVGNVTSKFLYKCPIVSSPNNFYCRRYLAPVKLLINLILKRNTSRIQSVCFGLLRRSRCGVYFNIANGNFSYVRWK